MTRYTDLERKLVHTRWINEGYEYPEEDALLAEMDRLWTKLTVEEREVLDREPPKSLIRTGPHESLNDCLDIDVFSAPGKAPRVGEVA
jgi:hypothetical protein